MGPEDQDEVVVGQGSESASPAEIRELEAELGPRPGDAAGDAAGDDDDDDRSAKVDTELEDAKDDSEREAIRTRRREERQRRKDNRNAKFDTLERTVLSLSEQNRVMAEQLLRLNNSETAAQVNQLDSAITEAEQVYNRSVAMHADAIAKSDGVAATQAMDTMFRARERHSSLLGAKDSLVRRSQAPRPIDPAVQRNAADFASRNSWYKGPQSQDPDSQVLTMLDNQVAAEGFNASTPEYWQELETRSKRYLRHRFTADPAGEESGYTKPEGQPRATPRSPVAGASQRPNAPANNGDEGGYKLSSERVKAMREAGIWDDPVRRKKLIAEYQRIDRANR